MDIDATPAGSSSNAALHSPRELSPDELAAERSRAIEQISSVLGNSGVRRSSRDGGSEAPAVTSATQTNAATAANRAPAPTAPSGAAARRIPQLLNDLLGMAPAHGRGGAGRSDQQPGNTHALPGRMSLSAGTYVVVQGMLVARGPSPASTSQAQTSNASATEALSESSAASTSQAETPRPSSSTRRTRVTRSRSRRRSVSDLNQSGEASASPPSGENQRANDSQTSGSQAAPASSNTSDSQHTVHRSPSGMTEMRGQLAVSPPSSSSEQSAMLTRMIAIATAATAVSLMDPSSSQRPGGYQATGPAADAQSAQTQGAGTSNASSNSSNPPATEGQGDTGSSTQNNNGAQARRPDSLASDLPSMLSSVLSVRPGGADHAYTPLSSDSSAEAFGSSDRPAWTPATLNETLSRVRNGTVSDGPAHTFDHFLHALSQDLHAAIQAAYGPEDAPQDNSITERRQRDVIEGNVSFFRMFRFGQPATESAPAEAPAGAAPSNPSSSIYPAWLNSNSRAQRSEQGSSASSDAQQEQLQPCLVVGIRSRPMEQNSPFVFPLGPAPPSAASNSQGNNSSSDESQAAPTPTADATTSGEAESGDSEQQAAEDAPIRYSLFISGGYYAADHPLLSNPVHIAARDLMMLMETLAAFTAFQPRRNVATTEDIKKSDLRTVTGKDLSELIAQDGVSENTVEKCLICLEDWQVSTRPDPHTSTMY